MQTKIQNHKVVYIQLNCSVEILVVWGGWFWTFIAQMHPFKTESFLVGKTLTEQATLAGDCWGFEII